MTGTSHAITGATIAAVVAQPAVALPLAFVSHYICDMIPHVGTKDVPPAESQAAANRIYLLDFGLICVFFGVLYLVNAPLVVLAGAFLAGIPDIVWFYRYIYKEIMLKIRPHAMIWFNAWHARIQWSETLRYGIAVEVVYSSVLLAILFAKI